MSVYHSPFSLSCYRGCEWEVKLLSCLVGVMVEDYYSTTSVEHPARLAQLSYIVPRLNYPVLCLWPAQQ